MTEYLSIILLQHWKLKNCLVIKGPYRPLKRPGPTSPTLICLCASLPAAYTMLSLSLLNTMSRWLLRTQPFIVRCLTHNKTTIIGLSKPPDLSPNSIKCILVSLMLWHQMAELVHSFLELYASWAYLKHA